MDKRILRRVKFQDRIARWLISAGGIGVIICVALMLLLIVSVTFPLFRPPRAEALSTFPLPVEDGHRVLTVGVDEYLETLFVIDSGAHLHAFTPAGVPLTTLPVPAPAGAGGLRRAEPYGELTYALEWENRAASLIQIVMAPEFDAGQRRIGLKIRALATVSPTAALPPGSDIAPAGLGPLLRHTESGTVCIRPTATAFAVERTSVTTDFLGQETTAQTTFIVPLPEAAQATAFTADREALHLYAATAGGELLHWDISGDKAELRDRVTAFRDGRRITSLVMVFGDISLAVGDDRGGIGIWRGVRLYKGSDIPRLSCVFSLPTALPAPDGIVQLAATVHDKGLLALDKAGRVHLYNMASRRHLLTVTDPIAGLRLFQLNLRGTAMVGVTPGDTCTLWRIHNPHPDISWRMLFGQSWYENYDVPGAVWQSSAANDDFEPKLSFIPLIFGSLKATFYAMLFAVPLALLGAIYISQFTSHEIRGVVKPAVEIMAAVPSVVIGFLIALWLAPRVESGIVAVFLMVLTIPLAFGLFLLLWLHLRRHEWAKHLERGREFVLLVPVVLGGALLAYLLAPGVERALFNGDLRLWLFHDFGSRYDQRNSLIIAFGLGFAVIPIIFTIAEDALSNVPQSLKAASLALGASRWQTVWRVVFPSASPGVFAAMIIGFGRAVGETMIVLMATGNTPILSLSPFNGMRTLSANIAVEIPEAPVGGTLYRVLFLSAVLLFLLTSVLNTAAELIRHHLRHRYGKFQ